MTELTHEEDGLDEVRRHFGDDVIDLVHRNEVEPIFLYTAEGVVRYMNDAALRIFRPQKSLIGMNYIDELRAGFPTLDVEIRGLELHRGLTERTLEGEQTRGYFEIIDDEQTRHMEVIYGPARDDAGRVVGVLAHYRDATEERRFADSVAARTLKLQEAQDFLESLLNMMDDGLLVLDADLKVKHLNATALRMLHINGPFDTLDDLVNTVLIEPDSLQADIRDAFSKRKGTTTRHFARNDHGRRLYEVSLRFSGDDLLCVMRDISDQQELRQVRLLADVGRLAAEKRRFDELGSRLLEIFFEQFDVDIAVLTRLERGRLIPASWRGLLLDGHGSLNPQEDEFVREAIRELRPIRGNGGEWAHGQLNGEHFIVPLVASGTLVGTLHLGELETVVSRDQDDSHIEWKDETFLDALGSSVASAMQNCRLFEQQEAERARLRTLIERMPDGVVLFDVTGQVLLKNEAAKDLMSFSPSNLNMDVRPYRILNVDGKLLPRPEWPFFRAVRKGETVIDERLILDFGDRRRVMDVSVVPVPVDDGQSMSYLGIMQDVTERSERDTRRDEFLSVASHELRSPLTPLMGFLQMLRRQAERGDTVDLDLMERSERQVRRLARLIDILLDMTRIETGRMILNVEPTDLVELATRVVDVWEAHPSAVDVRLLTPSTPMVGNVDSMRIDQVLTNLIDNAVKYSEEGDEVQVELQTRENRAVFSVSDHGEGIPPDKLEHLFDRYFQVEGGQHRGSMGLGLYITREIIQQHGGEIRIESTPGVGTRVEFEVPLRTH